MGVVDPHRPPLAERDEGQPLPVARNQVQARLDRLDHVLGGRRRPVEHRAGGDVHVRAATLEVQERAVQAGQAVRITHLDDFCRM